MPNVLGMFARLPDGHLDAHLNAHLDARLARFNIVGGIAAGFPSPAEGCEDNTLDLRDYLVRNPAATFFFRVRGDALIREGVLDGSVLVVDRSVSPRPGKLAVIEDAGAFAVVRLGRNECVVAGVVVACVTKFR